MKLTGIILGNIGIMMMMVALALIWAGVSSWVKRGRVSQVLHAYSPSRAEWSAYYWHRARGYMLSYALVLMVLILLPVLLGRRTSSLAQLQSFINVLPGLIGYFVLASMVPARFKLYPEGFSCFALIPFLPGRRERGSKTYSDFRVGLRLWGKYHDAVPRGEVLILRGEPLGAELIIPHGQRDRLLNLAREGLKRARNERRISRKEQRQGTES